MAAHAALLRNIPPTEFVNRAARVTTTLLHGDEIRCI